MTNEIAATVPDDFSRRVKNFRDTYDLTQAELAEMLGVSFASINRWENGQNRPRQLMWQRFLEVEQELQAKSAHGTTAADPDDRHLSPQEVEFSADPRTVRAVAEAFRLRYGFMYSPAFASEISLVDPLPHQRIAVYDYMLKQEQLRFLLADDAGAGKTIMTGLYVREMISRGLLNRVLVVSPAGLVGNWQSEMCELMRLEFRIAEGADARDHNPFSGPESDLMIVSVDTLAGEGMFNRLKEPETVPYDLVVFDEAHKLSADRLPDFTVRKTRRYRLAEALAGAEVEGQDWRLSWSARHLLLLTATPHMGKDLPYHYLWRLLLPEILPTPEAFGTFPAESRRQHFIRRVKEELVHQDGTLIYPRRRSDTLIYPLSAGERELYEETTLYITDHYTVSRQSSKRAVRLAMVVLQRRLTSSTYSLLCSLERRREKIDQRIAQFRSGVITEDRLIRHQAELGSTADPFEEQTADDDVPLGGVEQVEAFEDRVLGGITGVTLEELKQELVAVDRLLARARNLHERGEDSKFAKLREVLEDQRYADEKFIIFTEHRDTGEFLFRRLAGLGYTGQVALIHGGMSYRERERQVEFFKNQPQDRGARILVATDAAGEGVNLQWCWLMVNYDIPWNPARLEQRLGRIHRYGQKHDPVVVINLVADETREGRVLKVLLVKLDLIRAQLDSDKVFDVIGSMLEDISIREHIEQLVIDDDPHVLISKLEERLTEEQVLEIRRRERDLFGDEFGGLQPSDTSVAPHTDHYRQLLPGYARQFVLESLPLLNVRVEGDVESIFRFAPAKLGAIDPFLPALESYSEEVRSRLTVYKPNPDDPVIWLRPGESIFERISELVTNRFHADGLRGAVFLDPYANQPYLFHLAAVSTVLQHENGSSSVVESRLVGIRQYVDGKIEECPVDHLLLLRGLPGYPPSRERIAQLARYLVREADDYIRGSVAESMAQGHRQRMMNNLSERVSQVVRGLDYQAAELAAARVRLTRQLRMGSAEAETELLKVKRQQRSLPHVGERRIENLRNEPDKVHAGESQTLVHALVVPSRDSEDRDKYDARVEEVAVQVATAYETGFDADVQDVSTPDLARRAGLDDSPGFDLLSRRPANEDLPAQDLAIEVKGRAGKGGVEMTENEWLRACNLRDEYWLYVALDCATDHPQLFRVRDPFGKFLGRRRELTAFSFTEAEVIAAAE